MDSCSAFPTDRVVKVDSSYCYSFYITNRTPGNIDLFITYHNGAVYWFFIDEDEWGISLETFEEVYKENQSYGKTFWKILPKAALGIRICDP
jgi:hypothetical protein